MQATGSFESLMIVLGMRDIYTRLHSERVAMLSRHLGIGYGLAGEELEILTTAARFHDIGKIGIPDYILLKPGNLSVEEWQLMKTHAELGGQIFAATGHPHAEVIATAIYHHHELFDGSGYPSGLKGTDIPLFSRILQVADNYDALGELRPYRPAKRHREIMNILKKRQGIKHDPDVFQVFNDVI
ncbi:MAG: HD-GYP domain-containing protein, partial [Xanthomonadaceae bacterium]|nr:HD-GYP domain-containing protein [Xanthomonadaceae bacterium]